MPIKFKVTSKVNSLTEPPTTKYYPCAVRKEVVDLEALAEQISESSTVSEVDCYAVVVGLRKVILQQLMRGNSVNIDHLGTFSISLAVTGETEQSDVTAKNILNAKINFKPDVRMKRKLAEAKFKKNL